MSHECNKYIIDGDVFLRDFEAMYANEEDPWSQHEYYQKDVATMSIFYFLKVLCPELVSSSPSILDIGCADGYHAKHFIDIFPFCSYTGTDISPTVVSKASQLYPASNSATFVVDDCRKANFEFNQRFDLIFSSKTLYYVAPEIDSVLNNIKSYLIPSGYFCFVYNQSPDSFTNRWLTYEVLREKLLQQGFIETFFAEFNRFSDESISLGIFKFN